MNLTLSTSTLRAALFVGAALAVAAATSARPNIVFIMADDLGWADVAFHGGNAPTPQLDRLAAGDIAVAKLAVTQG